jgi:hypothetical protein
MYVYMRTMNPILVALCLGVSGLTGCAEEGGKTIVLNAEGRWLDPKDPERDGTCEVTAVDQGLASFVGGDTLDRILADMQTYFQSTNDGAWAQLLTHYPMHRENDTTMAAKSAEMLQQWWDFGLRNRTEWARVAYVSKTALDTMGAPQHVVLLNMDLSHYVEFLPNYTQMDPSGMRGMVESLYGKGTATYFTDSIPHADSTAVVREWQVKGETRIWAVMPVGGQKWCFLPANFNEGGGAKYMGGTAMVELLKHRTEFDPRLKTK